MPEGFPAELLHLMRSCVDPVAKRRPTMMEVFDGLNKNLLPVSLNDNFSMIVSIKDRRL